MTTMPPVRWPLYLALGLLAGACAADLGGEPAVTSTWSLEVESNGGLVDPRFPQYGIYPNPLQVDQLEVRLDAAGQLCAHSGGRDWCGGPISGIPYQVHQRLRPGFVCHRVVDMFGHEVIERCSREADVQSARALVTAAEMPAPGEERCQEARDATGAPCLMCMDAGGIVTKNTCLNAGGPQGDIPTTGSGSNPSPVPGDGVPSGAPGDGNGTGTPSSTPSGTPDGSSGGTAPGGAPTASGNYDCAAPAQFGAQLLLEEVNEGLGIVGMGTEVTHPGDLSHLNGADADDLVVGRSHCFDVFVNLVGDYLDDGPGSSDYVYGPSAILECTGPRHRCRVGQMVTRSMYEACMRIPVGCDQRQVEEGIVAGGAHAIQSLCAADRPWECRGSPLVLDLNNDGVSLLGTESGVRFPLMSHNLVDAGWVRGGDDALLAVDRGGSGCVEGGDELFGEASSIGATSGFAALAAHDDNHDGVIDARDAIYPSLLAWNDDGDGACTASEVSTIASKGVSAIALDADDWGEIDEHGNELGLLGRALSDAGRTIPVVDVWFKFRSTP